MKIQFWSVGKSNESYVNEGIVLFNKRLAHYYQVEWNIIQPPKNMASLEANAQKQKEGEQIIQSLHKEDYLVLLDERGKQFTSEQLANFIQQRANDSTKTLVFLIGGAFGVSDAVMKRANFTWSLSPLVFPHQLVRLILSEQVYRACTINRNEKYHHV
ncbi:MAG: 23S rRNA (pseudouridine(1915)-N(3))-methyltransferase RlmH [Ferruginibacter sp.]